MYAFRILRSQPQRFLLTVSGIALCVVLMLFLVATYQSVADGSVDYIRSNRADFWVLQRNATNILRGSSILSKAHGDLIKDIQGVQSVSPVLLLLTAIRGDEGTATVFLAGFEPRSGLGGPPVISEGRSVTSDSEIVLDRAFARKFGYSPGDRLEIQDKTLRVVGLSTGTNAFVIQYAFVTLACAQSLIRFPGLVSCFLVKTKSDSESSLLATTLRKEVPGVEVYDHATFLANNIREMQSGFLPLLYTIAVLGAVVLTIILSLLLSITIVERRADFAVMKTLGCPPRFLRWLVIQLGLIISSFAALIALVVFFPLTETVQQFSPEITTTVTIGELAAVLFAVIVISIASSAISIRRLRSIYPQESFQ